MSSEELSAHFLLFTEAQCDGARGTWRFVLSRLGSRGNFAAADSEPIACRERLELFALVRGLEAIDQPGRVTLVTNSRYVTRGLKHGLAEWKAADWQWERFGQLVPVRDRDLWRRVDRALAFHELDCRMWHFDYWFERRPAVAAAVAHNSGIGGRLRRRSAATAACFDALPPASLAAG